ncbi:MAG: hypothetical protein ABIR33_17935 [Pyrinomonadaceae bacterium]
MSGGIASLSFGVVFRKGGALPLIIAASRKTKAASRRHTSLILARDAFADAEDVAVGVADLKVNSDEKNHLVSPKRRLPPLLRRKGSRRHYL